MDYRIKPCHDWLLIQTLKDTEVTKGGIIISQKNDSIPNRGVVLAAGPGRYHDSTLAELMPMFAKVGDTVLFSRHGRHETHVQGEEVVMVRDCELLGIVEPEEKDNA